jgi:hypothetical protein
MGPIILGFDQGAIAFACCSDYPDFDGIAVGAKAGGFNINNSGAGGFSHSMFLLGRDKYRRVWINLALNKVLV